jgi:branched-chain amino acid transport system substrate-binding protein
MRQFLKYAGFVVATLVAPVVAAEEAPVATTGELLVGMILPSSGPERERGEAMRNGATLAVESVNRSGAIHGVPLRLRIEESGVDGRSKVKAFSDLASNPDVPVVISGGEDEASVIKGLSELNQTLVLSNSMRTDSLKGVSSILRVGRSFAAAQSGLLALMKERRISRVALLHGDQAWVESAIGQLMLFAKPGDLQIVSSNKMWDSAGNPEESSLARMNTGTQEFLYLMATHEEQVRAIDVLRTMKITPPLLTLFACSSLRSIPSLKGYPAPVYSIDGAVDFKSNAYREMYEAFSNRYPKLDPTFDTLVAYDSVKMVAAAYRAGMGTGPEIREYLAKTRVFDGAAGRLEFTIGGDSTRPVEFNAVSEGGCKRITFGSAE